LVVVIVVALATGALLLGGGGGDDAQVAIAPRQTGPTIPDSWKTITADPGITLSVPADWEVAEPSATPIGTALVNTTDLGPDADSVLVACTMGRQPATPPSSAGSALSLWEFPGDSAQVPDVANSTLDVVDRPETFAGALVAGPNECEGARYDQLAFRDAGRVFLVRVVSVFPTAEDEQVRLRLAAQVLDTLRVEPLEAATTTTAQPFSTTIPPTQPTATTAPAFVPTSDDEQEIAELVVRWLHYETDDELRSTIVDADSILDAIHEGMRQYQGNLPDGYTGRIESLRFADPSHADFVFTLFLHGSPLYSNQTGHAVQVDGRWMVTRESECSLLALGSISCPPA
jgi:hypothetical protein